MNESTGNVVLIETAHLLLWKLVQLEKPSFIHVQQKGAHAVARALYTANGTCRGFESCLVKKAFAFSFSKLQPVSL
jgi:hypothetical protein